MTPGPGTPSGTERDRAYLLAGIVVIERCEILVAVWDGLPARGVGGTGEVVRAALQRHRRVIVVDPAPPCTIRELR